MSDLLALPVLFIRLKLPDSLSHHKAIIMYAAVNSLLIAQWFCFLALPRYQCRGCYLPERQQCAWGVRPCLEFQEISSLASSWQLGAWLGLTQGVRFPLTYLPLLTTCLHKLTFKGRESLAVQTVIVWNALPFQICASRLYLPSEPRSKHITPDLIHRSPVPGTLSSSVCFTGSFKQSVSL